jgi:ABC-2 type transport system ATP-binding protein
VTSDDAAAIEVDHVSKSFGDVHALRDVSLRVRAGSIFGFLGPNGAGKTTTMRGLMGLMRFDGGDATMLGLHPWRDRVALHARVGYLPSDMGMYPKMRGVDVLDYAAALSPGPGRRSPLRARVLDALELSERDLRRPERDYSRGMRQKVAICQAIQHDPELLLMDEPTEGLDPLMQHRMYELLRERSAAGRTVLFSSHTLSEVEALCDEVAFIRHGALVAQSTLDALREHRPLVVRIEVADDAQLATLGEAFDRQPDDHAGNAVFHVLAPPDEIVAALAGLRLQALLIEEPSLDEIFSSYYAGEEGG